MTQSATLSQHQILQRITRDQGPEQEQVVTFLPQSTVTLPASLKTDRFIYQILVRFHGRLTVTSGFTPIINALWNLMQEFRVSGTHVQYGSQVPYRLRGATVRDLAQIWGRGGYTPYSKIFKAGTIVPAFDGAASTAYDVDVVWPLFLAPLGVPFADSIIYGALKGPDWAGDLHLAMDCVDATSLGTTAGNVAFSAYGSGSGSPQILVSLTRPCMTVDLMNAISPAICFKTYRDLATVLQGPTIVGQKITDLNIGKGTLRSILRTGTLQTSVSTGVIAMASLSDSIVTRSYPALDGKPIKNPFSNQETKEWENFALGNNSQVGYQIHDWIEGGNVHSMFRSQTLTAARRFEIDGDVTGAANQGGEEIQEEILGTAVISPVSVTAANS